MESANLNEEKLPLPPSLVVHEGVENGPYSIKSSDERIFDEHKKMAQENSDRMSLERVKAELSESNEKIISPEEVLIQLAKYSEGYMGGPIDAVIDGNFADPNKKLLIEDGTVVLIRHASDSEHLIKSGKEASLQQMRDSSEFNAGAPESGAIHTSADVKNFIHQYSNYPVYGEFIIPVKDFLELGKNGKIIIGNFGESEIVISGDVAVKYLTKIVEKSKVN